MIDSKQDEAVKLEAVIARLRELLERATPGPWQLQDGCSWRRIGTAFHDGDVLCPNTYSREDRHPDLTARDGRLYDNLRLIVEGINALPTLLDAATLPPANLNAPDKQEALAGERVEAEARRLLAAEMSDADAAVLVLPGGLYDLECRVPAEEAVRAVVTALSRTLPSNEADVERVAEIIRRHVHNKVGGLLYGITDAAEEISALSPTRPAGGEEVLIANLRGFEAVLRSEAEQDREDGHNGAADMRERRADELREAIRALSSLPVRSGEVGTTIGKAWSVSISKGRAVVIEFEEPKDAFAYFNAARAALAPPPQAHVE